jgi:hypothetical protein
LLHRSRRNLEHGKRGSVMASTPVQITDVDELAFYEDPDFFFYRLGETKIANEGSRSDCSVTVSRDTGHAYIAVGSRLYIAKTRDLESWLSKIDDSDSVPSLPTLFEEQGGALEVSWTAPGTITSLSLTQDGGLLAVAASGRVHVFRATDLACVWETSGGDQDATTVGFSGRHLAILGATGRLNVVHLDASGGDAIDPTPQRASEVCRAGVSSFAFSPPLRDQLAFGVDDEVRFYDLSSGTVERSVKLTCDDVLRDGDDDDNKLKMRVDGLVWTKDRGIMVSAEISPDGDRLVTILCLTWTSDRDGVGYELQELYPTDVSHTCPPDLSNQMLVGATVSGWDEAAIISHKGNFDGHIRPFISLEGASGTSIAFENITEDKLCIRIPNAPGDEDNCVRNICLDFTMGPACPHPLDDQAEDLQGFPRAWILTSDGLLRAYIMGSVSGRPSVCSEARPIPEVADLVVDTAGGSMRGLNGGRGTLGEASGGSDGGGNALLMAGMAAELDDASDSSELASDGDDLGREAQERHVQNTPKTLFAFSAPVVSEVPTIAPAATQASSSPPTKSGLDLKPVEPNTPEVPFPQAALAQAGGDFPRIEAEFLQALHTTRELERETYGIMSSSMDDLRRLRGATNALLERARCAVDDLAVVRDRFADVATSLNDSCGKVDAMPLFQRVNMACGDPDGRSANGAKDAKRRGLDSLLASSKESVKEQLKQLSFAAEELRETMSILQEESRRSAHDHPIHALEESVAAQAAIVENQTSRINALWDVVKPKVSFSACSLFRPSPTRSSMLHVSPKHDRPKWVTLAGDDSVTDFDANNAFHPHSGIGGDAAFVSDVLAADILGRAVGNARGAVRLTVARRAQHGPRRLSSTLQPLEPIDLADIPEPVAFVEQKLNVVVPAMTAAVEKPKVPVSLGQAPSVAVSAAAKPAAAGSSGGQPPIPSFGMLEKSKNMMAAAAKPAAVPAAEPAVSSSGQPPIPSFGMLEKSKNMMAAAAKPAAVPAAKPALSASLGQAPSVAVSAAAKPSVAGSGPVSSGGGFGAAFGGVSSGASGQAGFGQASGFGTTPFSVVAGQAPSSSPFGQAGGFGQASGFGTTPFSVVAGQAPSSSPFGQATFGQAGGASSSPNVFGSGVAGQVPSSSPFGQATFGQAGGASSSPNVFGSGGAGQVPSSSPFGQAAFGQANSKGSSNMWAPRK